jgi:hypothetical protein
VTGEDGVISVAVACKAPPTTPPLYSPHE